MHRLQLDRLDFQKRNSLCTQFPAQNRTSQLAKETLYLAYNIANSQHARRTS